MYYHNKHTPMGPILAVPEIIEGGIAIGEIISGAGEAIASTAAETEIAGISGVIGGNTAGAITESFIGDLTFGQAATAFSELISSGELATDIELTEITGETLSELGVSAEEFAAFDVESSEAFEGLDEETKGVWSKLKDIANDKLGDLVNGLKRKVLECKNSFVAIAVCIEALRATINQINKKLKGKGTTGNEIFIDPNGNQIADPTGENIDIKDPFALGLKVAEITTNSMEVFHD